MTNESVFGPCPCGGQIGSPTHQVLTGGELWCSRCGGMLAKDAATWKPITFHIGVAAFMADPSGERLEALLRQVAYCDHARAMANAFQWCHECGASEHGGAWIMAVVPSVLRGFFETHARLGTTDDERRAALFTIAGGEKALAEFRRLRRRVGS